MQEQLCKVYEHLNGLDRTQLCNSKRSELEKQLKSIIVKFYHRVLSCNNKEYFNFILNPDADLDHRQNPTTTKLGQVKPSLKISAKFICNFLRNPAHKTNR